jgi:hypothetical protein
LETLEKLEQFKPAIKYRFEDIEKPCYFCNNMPRLNAIQWKALFLLLTFSASFTIFCHCACAAAAAAAHRAASADSESPRHSCCDKMPESPKQAKHQHSHRDCQGMQAVRFNLLEKQTADPIHSAPAPFTGLIQWGEQPTITTLPQTEKRKLPQQWSYKHSPPNRLSLYQCFLI